MAHFFVTFLNATRHNPTPITIPSHTKQTHVRSISLAIASILGPRRFISASPPMILHLPNAVLPRSSCRSSNQPTRTRARAIYSAKSIHYAAKSSKACDAIVGRGNVLKSTWCDR
jgi:hypothetical protein